MQFWFRSFLEDTLMYSHRQDIWAKHDIVRLSIFCELMMPAVPINQSVTEGASENQSSSISVVQIILSPTVRFSLVIIFEI